MKKTLLSLLVLLALAMPVHAQFGNTTTIRFPGTPTGSCAPLSLGINNATGAMYDCVAGVWTLVGGGGGGSIGGSIAATQVAFGSGVNTIAGSANFIWSNGLSLNVLTGNTAITAITDDAVGIQLSDVAAPTAGIAMSPDAAGTGGSISGTDGTHGGTLFFQSGNIVADPAGAGTPFFRVNAQIQGQNSETLGSDNSVAGTLLLSNSAANAHTIWGSAATTTNTINGFATVPTTGHLVDCAVTGTTCVFHDSGVVTSTVTKTIASGAKALATTQINSAACSTAQTDTATGTLTTDAIQVTSNADITGVTGYAPVTTGMLTIFPYPTADTVNFKVCNLTALPITPGAVTLNWRVTR